MLIEIREHEGCFYATCEQMPGFLLASRDMKALDADIFPAMKLLVDVKREFQMSKTAKKPARRPVVAIKELVAHRELAFA